MNMKTEFASRLQTALHASGRSRDELARRVGVAPSTVSRWANGISTPDVYQFREIARFFDVSYEWLLRDANPVSDAEELSAGLGLSPDTVKELVEMAKTESPEVMAALDSAIRSLLSTVDAVYSDLLRMAGETMLDTLQEFGAKEDLK